MASNINRPLVAPANPGASGTATVYDSGVGQANSVDKSAREMQRCTVAFFTNVADAVLRVQWQAPGGTLRLVQADTTISASTFFQRDIRLQPGRTVISIVTVTAPTTWEIASELSPDRALAQ